MMNEELPVQVGVPAGSQALYSKAGAERITFG
jgi:hypothetical protein